MLNTEPPTGAMRQQDPPQKREVVYSYQHDFHCRSSGDATKGCDALVTEIERILKVSVVEDIFLKIVGVKTWEDRRGKKRGRTKIFVRVNFEPCSKHEAHCYFSAESGVVSAPDAQTMVNLTALGQGSIIDRREKAATFRGHDHGQVTFFQTFETESLSDDKLKRRLQIYYAAATSSVGVVHNTSFEDPTELRKRAYE